MFEVTTSIRFYPTS